MRIRGVRMGLELSVQEFLDSLPSKGTEKAEDKNKFICIEFPCFSFSIPLQCLRNPFYQKLNKN